MDARSVSIRKFDDFTSNLVIARVEADSNGNYTCQVSNSAGFDQKSAVLFIKEHPYSSVLTLSVLVRDRYSLTSFPTLNVFWGVFSLSSADVPAVSKTGNRQTYRFFADAPKIGPFQFSGELDVGMRAIVVCAAMTGEPPFDFTWFKDDQKLIDTRGVSIKKFDDFTSNLVIAKVEADSNGNYTCKVSNSAGYDQKSAVLSVKDRFYVRPLLYFVVCVTVKFP
ncbi:uncharacterized protein TNCV_823121 [Trichonephila clavipes]|nr:uncharacterized protein TNCV_823121 [Trichonephila clavipes]